jgi:hypothetical protein
LRPAAPASAAWRRCAASRTNEEISSSGVPPLNTRATPASASSGMSLFGITPPTISETSASPASRSRAATLGTTSLCAPHSELRPTTSTCSSTAACTICSTLL